MSKYQSKVQKLSYFPCVSRFFGTLLVYLFSNFFFRLTIKRISLYLEVLHLKTYY